MPAKKKESAKGGKWSAGRQCGNPNKKQGSELWGSCATAWFRYIRPPGSEFLRTRQNDLPVSRLRTHYAEEAHGGVRIRLGRVREEGARQQRRPETR